MLNIFTNSTLSHLQILLMLFLSHYTPFSRQLAMLKFHPSFSTLSKAFQKNSAIPWKIFFSRCPYITSPKLSWLPRWLSGKVLKLPMQEIQETQVGSLGWEDPLEKGMATQCSILAWRIPWKEKPDGL